MRNLKHYNFIGVILLGITALFLSACSSTPKNMQAIPDDVNLVAVFDVYSIAQKAKLEDAKNWKITKFLKREIKHESKKLARILEETLENPEVTGLNFQKDLFMFFVEEDKNHHFLAYTAELSNEDDFVDYLEDVAKQVKFDTHIKDEKKYKYIYERDALIGWDNDKVIMLIAIEYEARKDLEDEIETLMEVGDKNITKNEAFNNFYANKKDVSLWLSTDIFESTRDYRKMSRLVDFDLSDNYLAYYLDFAEDKISLSAKFTPNEEVKKLMEKNNVMDNDFNEELLKYFPEKQYFLATTAINPMGIYDNLMENKDFEKEIKNIDKELAKEMNMSLEELFEAVKGSAIISLFGFENMEYTYTSWGYDFDESKATLLPQKYPISEAGYLSVDDKEALNQGKTVHASSYEGQYCINIQNILAQGEDVEDAIRDDKEVIFYEGGWEFAQKERTKKEYLPLIGLAFDLNNDDVAETITDMLVAKSVLTEVDDYYSFKFDKKYPAFLAVNDDIMFITNDEEKIKDFVAGDALNNNLADSKMKENILNAKLFSWFNLNYDDYASELKDKIEGNFSSAKEQQLLKEVTEIPRSLEIKAIDNTSIEINFYLKAQNQNSLYTIFETIDDNYNKLM